MRLLILISLFSVNLWANDRIQGHINHLVETTHQDLQNVRIHTFEIDNPAYFFISNFGLGRVFLGRDHYRVGFNPLIFKHEINDQALEGILAHELVHTEDYFHGSTLGTLLPIGLKVSFKNSRIQYERKTDIKTIQKGFAQGLIAYKEFQYPLLNEADLKNKKQEYLTPMEVEFVDKSSAAEVADWLNNDVPLNIRQFQIYRWFRNQHPGFNSEKRSEDIDYRLNVERGESLKMIPVTNKGIIKFSKTSDIKSRFNLAPNISGFIIYNENSVIFHQIGPF